MSSACRVANFMINSGRCSETGVAQHEIVLGVATAVRVLDDPGVVRLDRVLEPDSFGQLFEPLVPALVVLLVHISTMRRDASAWGRRFVGDRS